MNEEYIKIIQIKTADLVGKIDPENGLREYLLAYCVLTSEQIHSCYSEPTPAKKIAKILELLCRSPNTSFETFLKCLEKIGRFDLSDQLRSPAAQIDDSNIANYLAGSVNGATGVVVFFSVLSAVLAVVRGCQIAGCNGSTATQCSRVSQLNNTAVPAPQVNTCCPPSDSSRLTPEMEEAQLSNPVQKIGVKTSIDIRTLCHIIYQSSSFDEDISGVTFYRDKSLRKQKVISSSGQLHFFEQSNNSDVDYERIGICRKADDDMCLETILKTTKIEDVASSKTQDCIYSFDSNNNCVLKISDETKGKTMEVFVKFRAKQMQHFCKTISTTDDGEVLLLRNDPPLLCVFDSKGEPRHTIHLEKSMKELQHVKKCPKTGHYIISHGSTDKSLHRVCKVTRQGTIIRSYGSKRGIGEGHLNCPAHLAVDECGNIFIADKLNNLVLLLDSDLNVAVTVLSEDMHGICSPHRLCYDTECGRLLVGYGKCVLELVCRTLSSDEMSEY